MHKFHLPLACRKFWSRKFSSSGTTLSQLVMATVGVARPIELYEMIGVDTTDVKDLIMDQIQDLVKTDKVTDVGAMADYVKFIFSKFNSCIGNKTTGTLFKKAYWASHLSQDLASHWQALLAKGRKRTSSRPCGYIDRTASLARGHHWLSCHKFGRRTLAVSSGAAR
eukprot:COSAG01_NODE_3539_length_5953_cov_14.073891_4_plen_167_part_00